MRLSCLKHMSFSSSRCAGLHRVRQCVPCIKWCTGSARGGSQQQCRVDLLGVLDPDVDVINDGKTFVLRLRLQRKHTWSVVNHMAVVGMLTTLALYVRGIDQGDSANRSTVIFTLVLTVTAAQLVVADHLPKLPYLTSLC